MQTKPHMYVYWKELKAGGRTKPERCLHLEPTVRLMPHVMVDDEERVRDRLAVGVSIRSCCTADPVVRAGWWNATLERLPVLLQKYPDIDSAWLIDRLAERIAFPNVEERLVAHLMRRISLGRQPLERRAKVYRTLLEVMQGQVTLALKNPTPKTTYWDLVNYVETKMQALLQTLPDASESAWQASLGLDPGFTLEDLKRKYSRATPQHYLDLGGEGTTNTALHPAPRSTPGSAA